jgi:DNA-binding XRE family transcriptional regulator
MTPPEYKALRQQLGSQHAVAALLGVSRPTIARRESSKGKINKEAEIAIKQITKNKP